MYDPLVTNLPPSDGHYPDSFWVDPEHQNLYTPCEGDYETDVAIVGGGYTGLSAALHISQASKLRCTVLEANQPGWGCSGRNGGFVLPGTGRLGVDKMANLWGKHISQAVYAEYLASIKTVEQLIASGIDCDKTQGGYLKLAHKPSLVSALHQQAKVLSSDYGDSITALNANQIQQDYLSGAESFGGIYYPNAFGVNPWKLCQGLADKATQVGADIFGNTAVLNTSFDGSKHRLKTTHGEITAKHLIIATNAYGPRKLFNILQDRTFPVISSIIVTEPLSKQQLDEIGIKPGLMVMDTRALKYYYRVLPDNRLLFGGRGAIKGKDADSPIYKDALIRGLKQTFPLLGTIEPAYFWSGWVAVSLDDYPRIYHERKSATLYASGYCGAGLAFSIQAGKRLSQLLLSPDTLPELPYFKTPLKQFPLANLRRPALQLFYQWQALKQMFR